jgi:hypothetical protein
VSFVRLSRDGDVGMVLQLFNKGSASVRNVLLELGMPPAFQVRCLSLFVVVSRCGL